MWSISSASSPRQPERSWLSWVLLAAGALLLVVALWQFLPRLLGGNMADSMVGQIKLATDLNPFLERALAGVFGFIGAAIYVKLLLSFSWTKQLIGMACMATIWAVLYGYLAWLTSDPIEGPWFTTEGKPLRCYVLEPQRVRLLYIVAFDPVTGAACRPVVQAVQPKLRAWLIAQREAEKKGEKLTPRPVRPMVFFGLGGEPVVWYYRLPDGTCEYFEIPAVHPRYGVELKPITQDVQAACEKAVVAVERRARDEQARAQKQQEALAARKATEERQAAEMHAAAVRRQEEADQAKARFNHYVAAPVSAQSTVVATHELGSLASVALDVLRERGHAILLKPSFASEGLFDAVWNGGDGLSKLGIGASRLVVLVRPASAARMTTTAELSNLTYARQEFSVLFVRPADAYAARRQGFVAEGRAFSERDAQAALSADFAAKFKAVVSSQP